jgi:Arc/MetJ family transcription regulator
MPTNLALDDKLIEEARKAGKHKTKKDAVNAALQEYVQRRKQREILALAGRVEYWDDYDHKALRRGRRR